MRSHRSLALALAAVPLAWAASAGANDDASFVSKAARGGIVEVELGNYAAKHAANPSVRDFGRQMAVDHTEVNDSLEAVARQERIDLPTAVGREQVEVVERLTRLEGAQFDRAYIEAMVKDHQEDLAVFRAQAKQDETAVDHWAALTVPTLESHLERAKQVQQELSRRAAR
jgi:putative membrane protein